MQRPSVGIIVVCLIVNDVITLDQDFKLLHVFIILLRRMSVPITSLLVSDERTNSIRDPCFMYHDDCANLLATTEDLHSTPIQPPSIHRQPGIAPVRASHRNFRKNFQSNEVVTSRANFPNSCFVNAEQDWKVKGNLSEKILSDWDCTVTVGVSYPERRMSWLSR
jgi:hypothetical protein